MANPRPPERRLSLEEHGLNRPLHLFSQHDPRGIPVPEDEIRQATKFLTAAEKMRAVIEVSGDRTQGFVRLSRERPASADPTGSAIDFVNLLREKKAHSIRIRPGVETAPDDRRHAEPLEKAGQYTLLFVRDRDYFHLAD